MTNKPAQMLMTTNRANLNNLWHEKLGHLSHASMAKLLDLATKLSFFEYAGNNQF